MEFENNAKGMIDKLIYMNEARVNRENVIAQLDGIAMMEGEARDQAIQEYYLEFFKHVFRDAIKYREIAANDMSILKEDQQLYTMGAQNVLSDITAMMNAYYAEKNITPCDGKMFFGVDPEVIRDTIYGVCNEFKAIDTLRTAGRERKIDHLNDMRTNLDSLADKGYQYDANGGTTDTMIEELFVMYEERAAQYAKRGFIWKLGHLIEAIKTSWFLSKTEKDLKKIGFNKETHGVNVKARCEREPNSILKHQMTLAKDDCKKMQEDIKRAEWRKNNPELTIARDKFEKALAYYEDEKNPQRSFRNEVAHILDKYALDPSKDKEFSKVDITYRTAAHDFDIMRDTSNIGSQCNLKFMELSKAFLSARIAHNQPVNVSEIFKDAAEFVKIELKTFSVAYERDEYKEFVNSGVVPKGKKLEAIQNRLLNTVEKKLDPQEIERIKNDMQEYAKEQGNIVQSENNTLDKDPVRESLPLPELNEATTNNELSKPIRQEPVSSKGALERN
jgi:hypothetical protein